jgi:hypothetical protein
MNKKFLILAIFLGLTATTIYGQTCTHKELSNVFTFKTYIKKNPENMHNPDCMIKIAIKEKSTNKTIQSIQFTSEMLFDSSYIHCNNVRSYTTGINKYTDVVDGDYGDLIVADFNFDDREDFAFKKGEGGNGGPLYIYYVQKADSTFIRDEFLCKNLDCFPCHFNKDNKILTTVCVFTAISVVKTIYKFDSLTDKWSIISTREIDIREK